jgi:hypothetical protein
MHLNLFTRQQLLEGREIMVTKGERRLGRTIRKLENSVEFSNKESRAKNAEKKYREKTQETSKHTEDSPVQNLHDLLVRKTDSNKASS